jgi:hypothetical protein
MQYTELNLGTWVLDMLSTTELHHHLFVLTMALKEQMFYIS